MKMYSLEKSLDHFLYENRMSQAELSRRIGSYPARISYIKKQNNATIKVLGMISDVFKVPVSEFIAAGEEDLTKNIDNDKK